MQLRAFLKERNISLNSQQKKAVENINGKILLLAVPGSGKTTVIVTRIGYMVNIKKINPKKILTLTYSVSAAHDMKSRFEKIFGKEHDLNFRTIHSFCVMVLKEFEKKTGRRIFTLIKNQNEILAKLYFSIKKDYANEITINEIENQLTYCKNTMLKIDDIKKIENTNVNFYSIYCAYEKYKVENKLMDFDDQLIYAYEILKGYPSILNKFRNTFEYINIDEAQDTSKIQHEIIRLLARKEFIHGWRRRSKHIWF